MSVKIGNHTCTYKLFYIWFWIN